VVIERFAEVWPGETCGTPMARAELTNTYWRLVRLGSDAVVPSAGAGSLTCASCPATTACRARPAATV